MARKLSGTYLRRNAVTLLTVLACSMWTIHYIFYSHCENKHSEAEVKEYQQTKPTMIYHNHGHVAFNTKRVKISSSTKQEKPNRRIENLRKEREPPFSSKKTPRISFPVPTENKWTKKWPRINLFNCSHIEYMNRGINSPAQIASWQYPRTGIVSFPGSGNTWTRHLIQQATGLWTGSVYTDKSLFKGGFRAELDDCEDGGTVAIKAHYPGLDTQQYCKFDRAVIVIRDPFRAVLSEFNWRATSQHTGVADPRLYKTKLWMEHVVGRTEKWLATTKTWIERFQGVSKRLHEDENPYVQPPEFSNNVLLVSYERMKQNATREMERVVKFLGLPEFRSHCVQTDVDGNFRRASISSESIECLFVKFDLMTAVEKRVEILADRVRELGLGDITSEFEGPGGDIVSEKCKHV